MDSLDFSFRSILPASALVCVVGDEGGDHGGGSGGGSSQGQGQGQGAGNPDDSTTDPGQGNTESGTVDIQELVTSTVNRAVSSQLNRRLPQAIAEGLSPFSQKLDSVLEQVRPQSEGADPPPTGAPADPATTTNKATTEDSEVRRLRTELDAIKKQAAVEREAQEADRKQRDEEALTGNLNTLLTKHGVEPLRVRGAQSVVRSAVKRDQDGQAVYQVQRDGYTEDLPLEQGVKEWLRTDEGKSYLSPQQTTGSGTRPSGQQAVIRRKPANKAQQKREAAERLTQQLRSLLASSEVDLE